MVRRPVQAPRSVLEPVSLIAAPTSASATPVGTVSTPRVELLADLAVCTLIVEAELTPKPALVDRRGSGAHDDMDLGLLCRSAHTLRPTFAALAARAHRRAASQRLREELAAIGRRGEREMLAVTGGVNTHRGAIWTLGLLTAAASMAPLDAEPARIAALAARGALCQGPCRVVWRPV